MTENPMQMAKKKYVKPATLALSKDISERWNPDTCGYGMFIKTRETYRVDGRKVSIGWTCMHPDAKLSEMGRYGQGYLPYCCFKYCPQLKAFIKALLEIRELMNK